MGLKIIGRVGTHIFFSEKITILKDNFAFQNA